MEVSAEELEITFIDAMPPPLPAGDFRISITNELSWVGGSTPPFTSEYDFTVGGPRFTIDPDLVHSMFPPPGNRGHFLKNLPHLIFGRRSVPWERTVDASVPQERPFVPWLWLMSLDEDEIAAQKIAVQTVTLNELLHPPAGILGPDIQLETGDGDPAKTQLMVIDVPAALLQQLMPSKEDLAAMASARLVSVVDKAITPTTEDGWFSVLMANRFPKNGRSNSQYVVSLEGYGTSKTNILYPNAIPAGYQAVRLVMLISWSFTNVDDQQTFNQLASQLSVDRLQLPKTTASTAVAKAFDMGYTALDHITRQGETTVSWYRGPLLPMYMPKNPPPAHPDGVYPSGDAALRFDPALAMFDTSIAAAWQVGRLLGMQDSNFAAAIARLRDRNTSSMHTLVARSLFFRAYGRALGTPRDFRELLGRQVFDQALTGLLGRKVVPALTGSDQEPILGKSADPSNLRRHLGEIPGLLSDEELAAFLVRVAAARGEEDADELEPQARARALMELIRNLGTNHVGSPR